MGGADHLQAFAAALVAVTLLLVPGGVVAALLGVRGAAWLAISPVVSIALVAGSAVLSGLARQSFGWWWPVATAIVVCLVIFGLRRVAGIRLALTPSPTPHIEWLVAAAVLAATVVTAAIAFASVPDLAFPNQSYDGVFHLNATASIVGGGDASAFRLYGITHAGQGIEFYPAAWHDFVAVVAGVSGASVPLATNVAWIVACGATSSAGAAFLAMVLAPTGRAVTAGVVAALASSAGAGGVYLLLEWGVLFPTALAYSMLPVGLGLSVLVLRARGAELWRTIPLLVIWAAAAALAHPRSLPTFGILVAPLIISHLVEVARRGIAEPSRRTRTVAVAIVTIAGVVAASVVAVNLVLRHYDAGGRPLSDRLNGGPATARQDILQSALQALLVAPPSGPDESALPAAWALAALVLIGLVVASASRRTRWIAIAYLLMVALFCLSAGTNSDFAKLATGLWYKDKYRLFAALGVIVPVLAAFAVVWAKDVLVKRVRPGRTSLVAGTALVALLTAIMWSPPTLTGMSQAVGRNYEFRETQPGSLLSEGEYRLLQDLPQLVPEGGKVIGNPWNGSVLSWAVGDRQAVFAHFTGEWGSERDTLLRSFGAITTDPAVCAALDTLGARYLIVDPGRLWGGNPQADQFAQLDSVDPTAVREIAREGDAVLYEITACEP